MIETLSIMGRRYYWFCYLFATIAFTLSIFNLAGFMTNNPATFFNSDAYYFPMMYRDIFVHGFPVDGWVVATANCFFPEMPLYFFLAFFGNEIMALYIWPVLFSLIWVVLASFLATNLTRIKFGEVFGVFLLISAIFLVLSAHKDQLYLKWLYSLVHPHGSTLMALSGLIILVSIFQKPGTKKILVISLICLVATASDKLFVPLFIFPATLLIFFRWVLIRKRHYLFLFVSLLVCAWLGIQTMEIIKEANLIYFASLKLKLKYFDFSFVPWIHSTITGLWRDLQIPGKLVVSLSAFFGGIYLITNFGLLWKNIRTQKVYLLYFIVFIWISTFCVIFSSALIGMIAYNNPVQHRYLSGVYTLHLLFLAIMLIRMIDVFFRKYLCFIVPILFILITCIFISFGTYYKYQSIYADPLAICLDQNKEKYKLESGLADYWNAKAVTLFSKKNIMVNQVTEGIEIYHWVNNLWWYSGKSRQPQYNFVITEKLDMEAIHNKFGLPDQSLECATRTIFVYDSPNNFLKNFPGRAAIVKRRQLLQQ